ncbi:MAG TPA: hypothetical protein VGM25_03720 [Caulobacteraceae bacterium]|jgi:hypothetical protein
MTGVWNYLTRNDTPKRIDKPPADPDLIKVAGEFEAYEPNATYAKLKLPPTMNCPPYPQIKPDNFPPIQPLDPPLRAIIDSMWKRAEPAKAATRSSITVGLRGQAAPIGPAPKQEALYHPHVNPLTQFNDDPHAFARDWGYTNTIERTNAVTFRGDSRPPNWVISKDMGFFPPNAREDDFYLYGVVFGKFKDYMKRRYDRDISMADYVSALSGTAPSAEAKTVLVNYMMWRKICEGEAFHLGRMVADEALKGYISTSRALPMSVYFATGRATKPSGWVYVTQVKGGFIVPTLKNYWGTHEQEIANWGPIRAADIVGFQKVALSGDGLSPIYIRPTFRKTEPKAFRKVFDTLSHKPPSALN